MASRSTTETPIGTEKVQWAKPLHIQRLERALRLDHFLDYVQQVLSNPVSDLDETTETEGEIVSDEANDRKTLNGVPASRQERRSSKMCLFNFSKVKKTRRWLKSILLSDSSESEEDHELTCTEEDFQHMLYFHKLRKAAHTEFLSDPEIRQYQYYSVGLLSNLDKYQEQQNLVVGGKKKLKEKKTITKKKATKLKKNKSEKLEKKMDHQGYILPYELQEAAEMASSSKDGKLRQKSPEDGHKEPTSQKSHSKKKSAANHDAVMAMKRRRLWTALAKKEISRAQKQRVNAHKEVLTMTRRLAHVCQRECRKAALLSQKVMKDAPSRARRLTREMLLYWKRYDKIEKEHRKRAEREAQEQMRMDIELREAKRQQRKLNFLITQTELYAHFMSKKVSGVQQDEKQKEILSQLDEDTICSAGRNPMLNIEENEYNSEEAKVKALQTAEEAYKAHQSKTKAFDSEILQVLKNESGDLNKNFRLTNPSLSTDSDLPQPRMFVGKLKTYQLKGMNWLHNLYDKGINGILADEMGLGKTVQTIALLATLAEVEGVWGPFLIIAPASTLHNWQQEFTKFIPKFKVLPYWGNTSDRKILRKFWSQKDLHTERASFHVLITSYQLVVQDVKYFQRVKWQYLVLDEAQAIKSTSSVRWKILLGFNCRNRLLLTGTPIQNSMAELWALLHFIMPTLFDSHEEFNEWFSKDIESHAENKSGIDERHLSRLHMILKPFMLRRIKKDVENELSDKIEILVYCQLTERQKLLYRSLKNKISIEDLMQSSSSTPSQAQSVTSSLLNLVMQFRKVCNHPDLFERREPRSSFRMQLDSYILPKLLFREGLLSLCSEGRYHLLSQKLGVFHPEHVHHSLFPPNFQVNRVTHSDCAFSFTRFIDISPAELSSVALTGLLARWLSMYLTLKAAYRIQHQQTWQAAELSKRRTLQHNGLLLVQTLPTVKPCALPPLVFTDPCSSVYTLTTHLLHCMPETTQHRQIRLQKLIAKHNQTLSVSGSPSLSPPSLKKLPHNFTEVVHRWRPTQRLECQTTELPIFLTQTCSKVVSEPLRVYCCDPSAIWWQKYSEKCGSPRAFRWIMYGDPDATSVLVRQAANQFNPLPPGGLFSIQPMDGWSHILIPDKETLVTDSGKLDVLDDLLMRLKAEGHRVLIYSQMTRMIDLLEEYMWHRKHTYMRLDGSSKISDRRDMVAGFQTRSDIFVFLLSTRAGGLGINLTAADTVIFYDSDWNPTVDQQAMDRAHRLGQTKQVTVYRLVCKGSIEERILQRAREKSEIQRMVISGGNFKPDTLKPKEVVSLLLDDEELEKKFRQRQEERRKEQEEANVDSGQRRKYKGAKRGPKPKRKKLEENITTPAPSDPATPTHQDGDSVLSVDSIPQSPYSELSVNSLAMAHDDTSSEGPLVVDDGSPSVPPPTKVTSISGLLESQTSNPSLDPTLRTPSPAGIKRGSGRGRGRPRGSGRRGGRGRGVSTLAVAAAEMAAAQAGKSAYAVYSYGLSGSTSGTGRGSVRGRGSGVARGHRGPPRVNHSQKSPSEGQSAEPVKTSTSLGFYVQNSPQ